jgi:hypothetical protein
MLDRVLAAYGDEAQTARASLRTMVTRAINQLTPAEQGKSAAEATDPSRQQGFPVFDDIAALRPRDDRQRTLQSQAVNILMSLGHSRWLMYEQNTGGLSSTVLAVLTFWLCVLFLSYAIFAPANGTVVMSLLVSSASVSFSLFLICELYSPRSGMIHLSSAPLQTALQHLGH